MAIYSHLALLWDRKVGKANGRKTSASLSALTSWFFARSKALALWSFMTAVPFVLCTCSLTNRVLFFGDLPLRSRTERS